MLEADKVFSGSIPENYDRGMVPLIFEPYAAPEDLARRAAALSPGAVWKPPRAPGSSPASWRKLPPGATYIVTDLNQPMLDYAASRRAPDSADRVASGGCSALPFEKVGLRSRLLPVRRDVLSRPHSRLPRSKAGPEARRTFLVQRMGSHRGERFCRRCDECLGEDFPNDPPRFMARTPHGYHDTALIRSELEAGRFFPCGDRDDSGAKPRLVSAHSGRGLFVRALLCATKSRPEMRENWTLQPNTLHLQLQTDMAAARLLPKSKHT